MSLGPSQQTPQGTLRSQQTHRAPSYTTIGMSTGEQPMLRIDGLLQGRMKEMRCGERGGRGGEE